MPLLRTYRLFISHAWDHNQGYYRLEDLLSQAPNFRWENRSVPEHDPLHMRQEWELEKALRDQMRDADVFLVLAGMWVPYRDWIHFEVEFARRIGCPILGVVPWGQQQIPEYVQRVAKDIVGWNTVNARATTLAEGRSETP
ncbi:MAG: TIR domain-containing protein [Planctomycetes bacterium]|nr:TIR domain-containing protein [Planctomycetota bacterium]